MPVIRYEIVVGSEIHDIGTVAYTESTRQEIAIANAASDTQLAFGGVTTADLLYIKSDQAISINLDSSSGTDITIDANKPVLLTGTAATAAYVSNASGSTANILYYIWGA